MQKKFFAAALILLMLVFMAVACTKNGGGDYTPVEYTTDDDGNLYVTNVYGDLIPVTTGADGSMELLEDLYTKTAEQAEKEKEEAQKAEETPPENNDNGGSDDENPKPDGSDGNNTGGVQVGSGSVTEEGREAVIVW